MLGGNSLASFYPPILRSRLFTDRTDLSWDFEGSGTTELADKVLIWTAFDGASEKVEKGPRVQFNPPDQVPLLLLRLPGKGEGQDCGLMLASMLVAQLRR